MLKWKRYGWTVKDEKARKAFPKFELRKNVLKSMLSSVHYPYIFKLYFTKCFLKFPKYSSLGFYRNYCLFTYSGSVVFRHFKMSRHTFKHYVALGHLSGFRKSSF